MSSYRVPNSLKTLNRCIQNRTFTSRDMSYIKPAIVSEIIPWANARLSLQTGRLCDPHIHSNLSDGAFTPMQIFKIANESNVGTLVITDHNKYGDILHDISAAMDMGIDYTFGGIELSMFINKKPAHIKVYFDPFLKGNYAVFDDMIANRCGIAVQEMAALSWFPIEKALLLADQSMERVFWDLLKDGKSRVWIRDTIGSTIRDFREMKIWKMAEIFKLASKGMGLPEALSNRKIGIIDKGTSWRETSEVFRRFLRSVLVPSLDIIETSDHRMNGFLERLHELGSWIVFAHPAKSDPSVNGWREVEGQIRSLASRGLLNGIEARHSAHSTFQEYRYTMLAEELNLSIDGGSDYHSIFPYEKRMGAGLDMNSDAGMALFRQVRRHLTDKKYAEFIRSRDNGSWWDALETARHIYTIDPYHKKIYHKIDRLLGRF